MKQLAFYQSLPRADALPLRERPVHRVAEAPTACNVIELLSALVGGPRQIETAEALLTRFGSLRSIRQASAGEIASVRGIGPQTAARLVSALELGRRLETESAAYDEILSRLNLLYGKGLLDIGPAPELHMDGASYLVGLDLHLTREKMRELFHALEEKKRMLSLLDQFLQELGMGKIAIVGHGLGAVVGLLFTMRYPTVVDRIMAVEAPLDVNSITNRLRTAQLNDSRDATHGKIAFAE